MANLPTKTSSSASTNTPAPLAPVLALTWLASLGTGAVTNGLFFVTHESLAFTEVQNLFLALVMGASYTLGAWFAAPLVRALAKRSAALTTKRTLALVTLALAAISLLPFITGGPAWTFWTLAAIYLPLTGLVWPITEAYLSGGRKEKALRRATGAFNICWSSAVFASFWAMAPLLKSNPLAVLAGMSAVHALCFIFIARLPAEPPAHTDENSKPHPPVYERLLPVFRVLLTLSYVLINAVEPILPSRLAAMGVRASLSTPIVSVWAAARVGMFALCGYWHGWHGRWRTVIWTAAAMLTGFVLIVTATSVPMVIAGLALFGVGVGGVYVAAIYYAMAVGSAQVDAGGRHEAVIGLGYTAGPLPALAAHGLVTAGILSAENISLTTIIIVLALAGTAITLATRFAMKR